MPQFLLRGRSVQAAVSATEMPSEAPVTTRLPARRCAAGATAAPWVTKHGTAPGGSSSSQRVRCMASSTRSRTTSQSEAHRTVVERRAVDVVVLGAGPLAAAAAYSLARRGKKVVLIPDFGIKAPIPPTEGLRPLHLPSASPLITHLTKEAASYWRGLQLQLPAGTPLFGDYPTLDLAASPITARRSAGGAASRTGGAAGGGGGFGSGGGDAEREAAERRLRVEEALQALQDSCKEAGVKLGALRGGELQAVVPQLRDPQGHTLTGLIQPNGGVVNPGVAVRALTSLAERSGVLVRERLVLQGWKDNGDHFVVSAAAPPLLGAGGALATSSSSSSSNTSTAASSTSRSSTPFTPNASPAAESADPTPVSIFEAEQLLLAPDESRWPRESLQLFGLDLDCLQVQERVNAACGASQDASRLPAVRYWGGDPEREAREDLDSGFAHSLSLALATASKKKRVSSALSALGLPGLEGLDLEEDLPDDVSSILISASGGLGVGGGVGEGVTSTSSRLLIPAQQTGADSGGSGGSTQGFAPHLSTPLEGPEPLSWRYALYPRAFGASACKMGAPPGQAQGGQQGQAASEQPPIVAFDWQPSRGSGAQRQRLTRYQRHASRMVRGVDDLEVRPSEVDDNSRNGRNSRNSPDTNTGNSRGSGPGAEAQQGASSGDSGGGVGTPPPPGAADTSVGLCLASPDGMPIVGFHPGFEEGRVVVACAVSGVFRQRKRRQQQQGAEGGAAKLATTSSGLVVPASYTSSDAPSNSSNRSNSQPAAVAGVAGVAGVADVAPSLVGDGFQLCPLLGKAAADLLLGASDPCELAPSLVSLSRPALSPDTIRASSRPVKDVDSWGELGRLQDGSAFRVVSQEDQERAEYEAEERRRALQVREPRRNKASAAGPPSPALEAALRQLRQSQGDKP